MSTSGPLRPRVSVLGAPGSGQLLPGVQRLDGLVLTCVQRPLPLPQEMIPFAVVGSDHEYQVNGKRILGRKTKWGTIEGNRQAAPGAFRQTTKRKLLLLTDTTRQGLSWALSTSSVALPPSHPDESSWGNEGDLAKAHSH